MDEINFSSLAAPVNGKRSIQPKKAFLLAGQETVDEVDDADYPNETPEERVARKEEAKKKKEQQLLMDQMDGVPLAPSS